MCICACVRAYIIFLYLHSHLSFGEKKKGGEKARQVQIANSFLK